MVWAGLLKKPLDVVHRRPHQMLVAAHGGRDAPHVGAARHPTTAVITVGHGHSLLKALFVPLVAPIDVLLAQ
jgi:hypothetical protein